MRRIPELTLEESFAKLEEYLQNPTVCLSCALMESQLLPTKSNMARVLRETRKQNGVVVTLGPSRDNDWSSQIIYKDFADAAAEAVRAIDATQLTLPKLKELLSKGRRFVTIAGDDPQHLEKSEAVRTHGGYDRFDCASVAAIYYPGDLPNKGALLNVLKPLRTAYRTLDIVEACSGGRSMKDLVLDAYGALQEYDEIPSSERFVYEHSLSYYIIPLMRLLKVFVDFGNDAEREAAVFILNPHKYYEKYLASREAA
ncbi:hypothetical protein JCM17961_49940 [Endothiovibrio diazotrophicus]